MGKFKLFSGRAEQGEEDLSSFFYYHLSFRLVIGFHQIMETSPGYCLGDVLILGYGTNIKANPSFFSSYKYFWNVN
jgi:hypothetical protein